MRNIDVGANSDQPISKLVRDRCSGNVTNSSELYVKKFDTC